MAQPSVISKGTWPCMKGYTPVPASPEGNKGEPLFTSLGLQASVLSPMSSLSEWVTLQVIFPTIGPALGGLWLCCGVWL